MPLVGRIAAGRPIAAIEDVEWLNIVDNLSGEGKFLLRVVGDSMIEENSAEISHDPLPTILADGSQLEQLFQNLIGNAIKFRKQEPPRIHISAREISDFTIRNADSAVKDKEQKSKIQNGYVFSVCDNGIGIAPEYYERIFTIFQRLHGRDEYDGTGIGLAICKRIIDRLGGEIWVESKEGNGSTFYFTIPNSNNN